MTSSWKSKDLLANKTQILLNSKISLFVCILSFFDQTDHHLSSSIFYFEHRHDKERQYEKKATEHFRTYTVGR